MDDLGSVARGPFVGRAEELAWLTRTLERARGGRPAIAVLAGEAGIGKTRLLRQTALQARRLGFRPLVGRCFEEVSEPFLPFVDALDDVLHELAPTLTPCEDARALVDVITGRRPAAPQEGPADNPDASHHRVLRVLTRALFSLARDQPVFLTLDDLHWADGPSLRLLEHLALRLDDEVYLAEPLRLVVVAAARHDQSGAWEGTLDRIRGDAVATIVEVGGLEDAEIADLLADGHGIDLPPVVVRRLATLTRGNPLHLESLVASLEVDELAAIDDDRLAGASMPATIGAIAAAAIDGFSEATREVLSIVAMTSGEADRRLIATVADLGLDEVEAAIDAAVVARVLSGGTHPDFRHSVYRHACLSLLSSTRGRAMHARTLSALLARREDATPEQLARHALAAGDDVDSATRVRWAVDAARRRMAATDWAAAAELFDAALALGGDELEEPGEVGDLQLNAALCHGWTGRTQDLEDRLEAAARSYEKAGDLVGVTLSYLAAVRARLSVGAWGQEIDVSQLAGQLELLVDEHPELAALVQADLSMALWVSGRSAAAASSARTAVEMAEKAGSSVAGARAHTALGISLLTLLEFSESRAVFERGLAIAQEAGDHVEELMVLIRLPLITGLMGDTQKCQQHVERALELCRVLDAPHDAEFGLAALCNLAGGRGDFIAAEQAATEVLSIARLTGSPWATPFVHAAVAAARCTRSDFDGARSALDQLLPSDPQLAGWVANAPTHRIMCGFVASMEGDTAAAAALVTDEVVAQLLSEPAVLGNGSYLAAVVEVARVIDDSALAATVMPGLADLVDRGQVVSAGMPFLLSRSMGLALRLMGRLQDAHASLVTARDIAHRERMRVEEVRALLDLADLAAIEGDARAATDLRETAAADIRALGMWGLAPRAGIRPRPTGSLTTDRLGTPSLGLARSVILFADISASTHSTEELGDLAFRYRSRQVEAAMRAAVTAEGGRAIEGIRLGDGILAEFATARAAVAAGTKMIEDVAPSGLELHVGAHQGDIIRDDRSIFGSAVNLASRICDAAGPSEMLISDVVAAQIQDIDGFSVVDLGERALKGVATDTRLHRVIAEHTPSTIGPDRRSGPHPTRSNS